MERLLRVLAVLDAAELPVQAERLVTAGGYPGGNPETGRTMLARDIRHLNRLGWDIRNAAPAGEPGLYRMQARDTRLRAELTAAQRAELVRAAVAAGRTDLARPLGADVPGGTRGRRPPGAEPPALDTALHALRHRSMLRFVYRGKPRLVHPHAVHPGPSGWYLRAREDGDNGTKEFVVARMSEAAAEAPGSASVPARVPRPSLDPLSWRVDPPVAVVLETDTVHRPHVEHLLGEPRHAEPVGAAVLMTYDVTHRAAFRWRIYELGPRVTVRGPGEMRAEIVDELSAAAEIGR